MTRNMVATMTTATLKIALTLITHDNNSRNNYNDKKDSSDNNNSDIENNHYTKNN